MCAAVSNENLESIKTLVKFGCVRRQLEAVCTANDKYSLSWNETVMLKLNEMINSGVLRIK